MMATPRGTGEPATDSEGDVEDVAELSYSDAGAELDAIIEEFETGVIDVDHLVDQLERATEIVDELDRRLRRTRMRVEELVPRLESIGQAEIAPDDDEMVEEVIVITDEETPPGLF
jgi:exodeoxyribonuclease VII small subunit